MTDILNFLQRYVVQPHIQSFPTRRSSDLVNNLTVTNTGSAGNSTVTLAQSTTVNGALAINSGVFDQSSAFNLITTGSVTNVVTVASGATWQNFGTGDLTLSGDVSNAGTINFNGNGVTCAQTDDILIRSSVSG